MAQPAFSDDAVQDATGHGWDHWVRLLRAAGAGGMEHKQIALWLQDEHDVPGWWAQSITVEFERLVGRRAVGQTEQGDYQVSVSRTLEGTLDSILRAWAGHMDGVTAIDGVAMSEGPTVSRTEKWGYWRVGLADGTRVNVVVGSKGAAKAALTASHEKLPDADAKDARRAFWKKELDRFKATRA